MKKIILPFLLVFSGVYWLPGVSITLVASIKYLILLAIILSYSKKATFNVSREFLKTDFFILLGLIVFLLFGDFSFGKIQYVISTIFGLIFITKVSNLKLSYLQDILSCHRRPWTWQSLCPWEHRPSQCDE